MNRTCVCAPAHMFVYMDLELGGGGGEHKNNVLLRLMCLMFVLQLCEPYVTSFFLEIAWGEETCNHPTIVRTDTPSTRSVRCSTVHVLAAQFQAQGT